MWYRPGPGGRGGAASAPTIRPARRLRKVTREDDGASTGTVAALRRYPVKSMLGEDLRASDVTRRGLAGDRVLALVHRETGKVASAKNPRLWRGLLKLAACTSGAA